MPGKFQERDDEDQRYRAGQAVLEMLDDYRGESGQGELGADRVLYGYLRAKFPAITRQHHVKYGRIDFRYGTTNPVVIEFVLRSPHQGRYTLFASQNRSELRKLTRVTQATARTRVMLLLDRTADPVERSELKEGYDATNAGRGNFTRHSVRVVYVHEARTYNFLWSGRSK